MKYIIRIFIYCFIYFHILDKKIYNTIEGFNFLNISRVTLTKNDTINKININ
jgi:hypothetical protein